MTSFSTQKSFPYSAEQLFELVADVKAYPEFIPGILQTRLEPLSPHLFKARVRFGNSLFQDEYLCRVELTPFESITIQGVEGPFTHLNSQWTFVPGPQGGETEVKFSVDFEFKNKFLQHFGTPVFNQLTQRMMNAFEERARVIYKSCK